MALITLSCFLRKGYEDKLVLAGEESCRASRIGRRQACTLLQVLSITYVSHSPPWLLLTTFFLLLQITNVYIDQQYPLHRLQGHLSIKFFAFTEADGFTVVGVKSWPRQCQQSQDVIPGFPLHECFLFCTKAGYGVTAAVSFWGSSKEEQSSPKKCRDVFRGRQSDVKWRDGWRWKNQPHNNLTSSREG